MVTTFGAAGGGTCVVGEAGGGGLRIAEIRSLAEDLKP